MLAPHLRHTGPAASAKRWKKLQVVRSLDFGTMETRYQLQIKKGKEWVAIADVIGGGDSWSAQDMQGEVLRDRNGARMKLQRGPAAAKSEALKLIKAQAAAWPGGGGNLAKDGWPVPW